MKKKTRQLMVGVVKCNRGVKYIVNSRSYKIYNRQDSNTYGQEYDFDEEDHQNYDTDDHGWTVQDEDPYTGYYTV